MHRACFAAVVLLLAGCGAGPLVDTPDAGESDAGATICSPPVPCFPSCDEGSGSCVRGTLDVAACECRDASGRLVPWPSSSAVLRSIEISAPPSSVGLGTTLTLRVEAKFSDTSRVDVTEDAQVTVEPGDALEPLGNGRFRATKKGTVSVTASYERANVRREAHVSFTIRLVEARAVWVTRFAYTNEEDVRRVINAAADARFNIVLFQVRGVGDAFYRSSLEPWSAQLGGLGRDPGWDPLQTAIDAAHARGIELHAYVNVFTGWSGSASIPESTPPHPLKAHPEWVEQDISGNTLVENMRWLAPGVQAVRDHNTAVVREIVTRYEIDGIHLDRVRYSGPNMGYNALEQQAFQAKYGSATDRFTDFRVESVNAQVRGIYEAIQQVAPRVTLSAAVWGIHTKLAGCNTSEGLSYYFQDSWAWAEGGYVDALAPMIYWANGTDCTDFATLLATFQARRGGRQIWAGAHVNQCASCDFNWPGLQQRIATSREQQAAGVALFASALLDSANAWEMIGSGPFEEIALVPGQE